MLYLYLFDLEAILGQENWNVTCQVTAFKGPAT
jgi:hypothetical protein